LETIRFLGLDGRHDVWELDFHPFNCFFSLGMLFIIDTFFKFKYTAHIVAYVNPRFCTSSFGPLRTIPTSGRCLRNSPPPCGITISEPVLQIAPQHACLRLVAVGAVSCTVDVPVPHPMTSCGPLCPGGA